ncbi:Succinate dehydrogenase [Handroanthus impetiginosus]|uniref:Succinate dehydrogenase n=1 Tax=Handroanthus impetiginosus TaxID=429701 RepID=A0A2G9HJV4_9LAMI|nr:Succinate dehydrogenase [Handroanthus impetiginosus]
MKFLMMYGKRLNFEVAFVDIGYWDFAIAMVKKEWIMDSRDEYTKVRLDAINDEFKLYRCHTILNCAKAARRD